MRASIALLIDPCLHTHAGMPRYPRAHPRMSRADTAVPMRDMHAARRRAARYSRVRIAVPGVGRGRRIADRVRSNSRAVRYLCVRSPVPDDEVATFNA